MLKEVLNFHHESDNVPVAMGLTEDIDNKCREIIHFSAFSNYFIKKEFFNDAEDDVPSTLTTLTGVLQKALSLCKTNEEEIYTLFIFRNIHKHCTEAIGAYQAFEEEADEKARKKMKMLLELVELKALADDQEDRSNLVTPKDMFKKIEAAKENLYNFDKYYSIINESKN